MGHVPDPSVVQPPIDALGELANRGHSRSRYGHGWVDTRKDGSIDPASLMVDGHY
jgi:hypothetical protein